MDIETRVLWLPKAGNAENEYEDAFYLPKRGRDNQPFTCALADGATESLLSRQWANLLVKRFGRQWRAADAWQTWLNETLRAWQNEKRAYMRRRERAGKPVQWYEEPGLEAGAFAALLGLVITRAARGGQWRAAALGDCCLAQVRADELVDAFPMQDASAFNNRPFLLSSNPTRNVALDAHWRFATGELARGDRLYLMTDALAAWFFRAREAGARPWHELDARADGDAFAAWIHALRVSHAQRNDDVTLIRLII